MAKPAFLRYLPARLKPVSNPAVWVPLTIFTLLGALYWEYQRNPDWFNRDPVTRISPSSSLTPEEEAQLSEIDNLDVLLQDSRLSGDREPVTSQITPNGLADLSAAGDADESESETSTQSALERYPIPGSTTTPTTLAPTQPSTTSSADRLSGLYNSSAGGANSSANSGSAFNFSSSLVNPAAPSTNSALSEALSRRAAARVAAEENAAPTGGAGASNAQPSSAFNGSAAISAPAGNGAAEAAPAAQPVPSFTRTTPEMSPPVGTTGYRPPATSGLPAFNVAPTQPTRSPFSLRDGGAGQINVPAPATQTIPTPATGSSAIGVPGSATNGFSGNATGTSNNGGTLYTAPTSVQPSQGRAVNPRR